MNVENQRTLARLLGTDEDEAAERLKVGIRISASQRASELAAELKLIIERTIQVAGDGEPYALEVVLDCQPSAGSHAKLYGGGDLDRLVVSSRPVPWAASSLEQLPALVQCICACYICSVALRIALNLPDVNDADPFTVEFINLGISRDLLERPIHLEDTILAGAGAIGNGFLHALRCFQVEGKLIIADPKKVKVGNLNRCLYFDQGDLEKPKAQVLCAKAAPDFTSLVLEPAEEESTTVVHRKERVRRVIVATDSRRVRRKIQNDLHLEVVDASTTEAKEVIVHSHRQPTQGACLACIYKHLPDEQAYEKEIANRLGITLADVTQSRITPEIAQKLVGNFPQLKAADLVGRAFDSLFRELCGQQALKTPTGGQVFAPFGFVSVFAGALLALELAKSLAGIERDTNYMALDPWSPPHRKLRRYRPRYLLCEFCSKPTSHEALKIVWPELRNTSTQAAAAAPAQ